MHEYMVKKYFYIVYAVNRVKKFRHTVPYENLVVYFKVESHYFHGEYFPCRAKTSVRNCKLPITDSCRAGMKVEISID